MSRPSRPDSVLYEEIRDAVLSRREWRAVIAFFAYVIALASFP